MMKCIVMTEKTFETWWAVCLLFLIFFFILFLLFLNSFYEKRGAPKICLLCMIQYTCGKFSKYNMYIVFIGAKKYTKHSRTIMKTTFIRIGTCTYILSLEQYFNKKKEKNTRTEKVKKILGVHVYEIKKRRKYVSTTFIVE